MDVSSLLSHIQDVLYNEPARYIQEQHHDPLLALIFVLGLLFLELAAAFAIIRLLATSIFQNSNPFFRFLIRKCGIGEKAIPHTFLELTFPANTTKSAFATEQLHILLQGLVRYYGFWDKLAAHKKPYSLEIVASQDEGIRYILMMPAAQVDVVRRDLLSFLPGLKIVQTEDYMAAVSDAKVGISELKLAADFILPLQDHKTLTEHDPIAYLTGHMTKLAPGEFIAFQIVTVPVFTSTHHRVMRRVRKITHRLALGKEVFSQLEIQRSYLAYIWRLIWFPPFWLLYSLARVIAGAAAVLSDILTSSYESYSYSEKTRKEKRQAGNPYERELESSIKSKLDQQLFEVSIRVLVVSPDTTSIQHRIDALISSFQPFTSTYQSIRTRIYLPFLGSADRHLLRFRERTLSPHLLSQQTIVSSSELSDLYHFPNTDLTKTEGFLKSRSRELPAPLSIKQSTAGLDIIMGVNQHGGDDLLIGMTLEQRQKHTYIIGKTGMGKTTLLTSSIYQDILSGKGLAVLDPHGDMFQELLSIIPKERQKDVVVFDPSDDDYPVGLNILDPGIKFKNESMKRQKITSSVLSVFKKLTDESHWGPRMEHILTNTTLTALSLPNPNLYTLQRLLTEKKYQKSVAKSLKDPVLKQFWEKEFALLGDMQLSTVTAPLTHRLGHFITMEMSRHILLQPASSIRIANIMNEGKILLVNLSKGDIGEDQSRFFGTILTSFIWMAAYQRTKIPEKKRRDFFLYVDEFQNFASPDFSDIVSEGRKYHISLIVSHQSIAQIEDKSLVKLIAGNASTLICLKVSPEDETFILPYMKPEVEKGDIVNLAPYHFYMKTTGDVSEDAFSGLTMPLDTEKMDDSKKTVLRQSRKQYGTAKATAEKYMEELFGSNEPEDGSKKPGVRVERRSAAQRPTSTKKGSPRRLHGG